MRCLLKHLRRPKIANTKGRRLQPHRRGVAAVEFALCFPVALILFLSQVFFVQFFITSNSAENAAYLGARRGIIPGSTDAEIENLVRQELARCLVTDCEVTVLRVGDRSTVRVNVSLAQNAWVTAGFTPIPGVISRTCTLRTQAD